MKINSTEVAKKAGVSRSTVSRVINNNPNVVESTREKVLKVIEELNYTPNTNAQTLAGKKSSVIGLFIVESTYPTSLNLEYFMNFVSKLSEEVFKRGYQLLLDVVYNQVTEIRVKSLFLNGNISCGIFIGSPMNNRFIDNLIQSENKIVLIDYSTNSKLIRDNVSLINTDDLRAASQITSELLDMGCTRILHIAGNQNKLPGVQRLKGYKQAINKSGQPLNSELIYYGDFTERTGYEAVIHCISNKIKFDSIFGANDLMARGAKTALEDNNLPLVPIWGFDNLHGSVPIGILSADPCLKESAKKAVKSLLTPSEENRKVQYTTARMIRNVDDYLQHYRSNHKECFFPPQETKS